MPQAGGAASLPPADVPVAAPEEPPRRQSPPPPAVAARAPTAEDADHEVASVNSRPGPAIDALTSEIARLREEKTQSRIRDRQEVRLCFCCFSPSLQRLTLRL